MSVVPPGANGTMKRTGFCGHDCAAAVMLTSAAAYERDKSHHLPPCGKFYSARAKANPGCEDDGRGNRREAFLPLVPVEKLDREHAQPAPQMRGQQHHDAPLGELDERLLVQRRNSSSSSPRPSAQK